MKKSIEERYEYYRIYGPKPTKTFEEYKAWHEQCERERAEKEAKAAEAAKEITTYQEFVEQAKGLDEDGIYYLLRKMDDLYRELCLKLHRKGDKDTIRAHQVAYKDARETIKPPVKRKKGPRRPIIASNVYDEDDNPTTYYL